MNYFYTNPTLSRSLQINVIAYISPLCGEI